jgi:Uma2 family endonuclease
MSTIAAIAHKRIVTEQKQYTLREYLAKEDRSVHKHEFHNGQIIRMPGSKFKHNEITINLTTAIKIAVKESTNKYRLASSDQKIYIALLDKALYADALVICEAPEYWENREDLIVNPLLIVEVASKSTRQYDRGDKFMSYRFLSSFKEYVLVEQDKPWVESWYRSKPNNWEITEETDLSKSISLRSIGVSISLEDIYENIEFLKNK